MQDKFKRIMNLLKANDCDSYRVRKKMKEARKIAMDAPGGKEDTGWRTTETGKHYHIGEGGEIDKGPAAMKGSNINNPSTWNTSGSGWGSGHAAAHKEATKGGSASKSTKKNVPYAEEEKKIREAKPQTEVTLGSSTWFKHSNGNRWSDQHGFTKTNEEMLKELNYQRYVDERNASRKKATKGGTAPKSTAANKSGGIASNAKAPAPAKNDQGKKAKEAVMSIQREMMTPAKKPLSALAKSINERIGQGNPSKDELEKIIKEETGKIVYNNNNGSVRVNSEHGTGKAEDDPIIISGVNQAISKLNKELGTNVPAYESKPASKNAPTLSNNETDHPYPFHKESYEDFEKRIDADNTKPIGTLGDMDMDDVPDGSTVSYYDPMEGGEVVWVKMNDPEFGPVWESNVTDEEGGNMVPATALNGFLEEDTEIYPPANASAKNKTGAKKFNASYKVDHNKEARRLQARIPTMEDYDLYDLESALYEEESSWDKKQKEKLQNAVQEEIEKRESGKGKKQDSTEKWDKEQEEIKNASEGSFATIEGDDGKRFYVKKDGLWYEAEENGKEKIYGGAIDNPTLWADETLKIDDPNKPGQKTPSSEREANLQHANTVMQETGWGYLLPKNVVLGSEEHRKAIETALRQQAGNAWEFEDGLKHQSAYLKKEKPYGWKKDLERLTEEATKEHEYARRLQGIYKQLWGAEGANKAWNDGVKAAKEYNPD